MKLQQEEAERQQRKEDEERKRKAEQRKRVKRMLEAAFDGDTDAMKQIIKEVTEDCFAYIIDQCTVESFFMIRYTPLR